MSVSGTIAILMIAALSGFLYYTPESIYPLREGNRMCDEFSFSVKPGDTNFNHSWLVAWDQYNHERPPCVLVPNTVLEVQRAVGFARANNVNLYPKSGGHNYAGYSSAGTGRLQISLEKIQDFDVLDYDGGKALRLGAGWRLGDVYYKLQNSQYSDYIVAGGLCPSVGAIPFHLGGGLGALNRLFGMGVDNMLEVELITSYGEIVIANRTHNQDLFWALRGGGGANFGIVTHLTVRLHSWKAHFDKLGIEPAFTYGEYCAADATDRSDLVSALTHFGQYTSQHDFPDWLTVDWRLVTTKVTNESGLCYLFYSINNKENTMAVLADIFPNVTLETLSQAFQVELPKNNRLWAHKNNPKLHSSMDTNEYVSIVKATTEWFPFIKTFDTFYAMELENAAVKNYTNVSKNAMKDTNWILPAISEKMAEALVDHFLTFRNTECAIQGMALGGSLNAHKSSSDTAFPFRERVQYVADCECEISPEESDNVKLAKNNFVASYVKALSEFGLGAFLNFPYQNINNIEYYYKSNFDALKSIKNKWNPGESGPLRFPQNI